MTKETQQELLLQTFRLASNMVNEAIANYGMVVAPDGRPREEMKNIQKAFCDFDSEFRRAKRTEHD